MLRNDSFDMKDEFIRNLRKSAPSLFSEGKVDMEKLKLLLGEDVENNKEKFGLSWIGKTDAIKSINIPSKGTLRLDKTSSSNPYNGENLLIEGDNLEVMKILQKSYYGKVKMVYIDPPYNTGNDFIYPDNFDDPIHSYLEKTGQMDNEGKLQSSDIETIGRRHSKWLSMMYPRIMMARNLLADNGVILISIDDHEYGRLKEVMDEIFGEEGHIATFVWRRRIGSSMSSSWISTDHEYVLAYSKNPERVFIKGEERDMSKYNIPDGNGRFFASMPLTVGMNKSMRPGQWYELKHPETGTGYYPPEGRVWAYYPPTMKKKIEENKVLFPEDFPQRNMTSPRLKSYPEDAQRERKPLSTWIIEKKGSNKKINLDEKHHLESPKNEEGTRILKNLLGDSFFTYPKPLTLIKNLVEQFTEKDDIVLDFFAGSGTTSHAVLDLNKEDQMNRKFIQIQLPEPIEHEEFNNIADISRERIKKAAQQLEVDGNFKYFRLDSSNFHEWDHNLNSPDAIKKQMELWKYPIKEGRSKEDLLYEVLLKSGFTLTANIRKHEVNDDNFYEVAENGQHILIYLGEKISDSLINSMKEIQANQVFLLDEAFASDDQKKNIQLQWEEEGIAFRSI